MVNRSYRIGYNFERRVIKHLEDQGYFVIRSGKSKFPDLVAIRRAKLDSVCPSVIIVECKVNKYLSAEEKQKALEILEKTSIPLTVYWRDGRKLKSYVAYLSL